MKNSSNVLKPSDSETICMKEKTNARLEEEAEAADDDENKSLGSNPNQTRIESLGSRFVYIDHSLNQQQKKKKKNRGREKLINEDKSIIDRCCVRETTDLDSSSSSRLGFVYVETKSEKHQKKNRFKTAKGRRSSKNETYYQFSKSTDEMLNEKREKLRKDDWIENSVSRSQVVIWNDLIFFFFVGWPPHALFQRKQKKKKQAKWRDDWLGSKCILLTHTAWLKESLGGSGVTSDIFYITCLALGPFSSDQPEKPSDPKNEKSITSTMLRNSQYQLIFLLDVIIPCLKVNLSSFVMGLMSIRLYWLNNTIRHVVRIPNHLIRHAHHWNLSKISHWRVSKYRSTTLPSGRVIKIISDNWVT